MGYSSILLGYSSILMGYSFILLGYSIINYPIYPLLGYHDYGTWGENWAPRSQKWPLCIPHFQTLPYSKNSNHQKDGFNLSQIICLNLFWDDFICLSFLGGLLYRSNNNSIPQEKASVMAIVMRKTEFYLWIWGYPCLEVQFQSWMDIFQHSFSRLSPT